MWVSFLGSDGVLCKGCSVKYAWMAEQGLRYPLMDMCKVLDVSVSGYRAWKRGGRPDRKRLTDVQMLALIRSIHTEVRQSSDGAGTEGKGFSCWPRTRRTTDA